tara:strand:- start:1036 stop:1530 length:495 start_codon:yes stop_codon:yes gene_type:complete
MNLKEYIIDVPDWPSKGINFKDISPLLRDNNALEHASLSMKGLLDSSIGISAIVGIESRGFIFGAHLAKRLGCGLIMARKKGKLPPPVISQEYELEYGIDTLEIKEGNGEKVIIVDDVYATGGTAKATRELCNKAGYDVVDEIFLINLIYINKNSRIKSVIKYN